MQNKLSDRRHPAFLQQDNTRYFGETMCTVKATTLFRGILLSILPSNPAIALPLLFLTKSSSSNRFSIAFPLFLPSHSQGRQFRGFPTSFYYIQNKNNSINLRDQSCINIYFIKSIFIIAIHFPKFLHLQSTNSASILFLDGPCIKKAFTSCSLVLFAITKSYPRDTVPLQSILHFIDVGWLIQIHFLSIVSTCTCYQYMF